MNSLRLGVSVDHIATSGQTRHASVLESKNAEPGPLAAAYGIGSTSPHFGRCARNVVAIEDDLTFQFTQPGV